jgi:hypothetical protein
MSLRLLRKFAPRIARTTLGLFVVVWMNMAAQPCLMALEADSANQAAVMTADAHGDEHCPHCPPGEMPDSSSEDLCSFVGAYDYDARTPGSDTKLKTQPAGASAFDWAVVLAAPSGLARLPLAAAVDEPHHHPPPFLDFCRFIE